MNDKVLDFSGILFCSKNQNMIEFKREMNSQILHRLNVRLPWLKVAVLALSVSCAVLVVEEALRRNISPPIDRVDNDGSLAVEGPSGASGEPTMPISVPIPPAQPAEGQKLVALTFDDGPSARETPQLLQILREKQVRATFFVIGNMAKKAPDVLRQEETDGHEVASHTMTHANLRRTTAEGVKGEVTAMKQTLTEILGHEPSLTRPPYGNINANVRTQVNQPLILWTVDPEDWKYQDTERVRRQVVENVFDGAIILLHDPHATTVAAVPGVIDDLRAAGYEFLTISELAAKRGVVLQKGVSYGSFRP